MLTLCCSLQLSASFYGFPAVEEPPHLPPKKPRGSHDLTAGHLTSPVLLSPPSGWEGPLDNLSQDDIHEIIMTVSDAVCLYVQPTTEAESLAGKAVRQLFFLVTLSVGLSG